LAEIDGHLPGCGLGSGLHEICPEDADLPSEAAATQLAALLLGRADGPVLWVLSKRFLFAPGLAEAGLSPSRLLFVETHDERAVLSTAEEALRRGGFGAVMLEAHRLSLKASRRLQLAAESTGTVCFALRRWKRGTAPQAGTSALTRWVVGPRASAAPSGLPRPSWRLELVRCRGAAPRSWNIELEGGEDAGAPLSLRLAAELAGPKAGSAAGRRAV
jgi:protein ImuA